MGTKYRTLKEGGDQIRPETFARIACRDSSTKAGVWRQLLSVGGWVQESSDGKPVYGDVVGSFAEVAARYSRASFQWHPVYEKESDL